MTENDYADILAAIDDVRQHIWAACPPWDDLPAPWCHFDWILLTMRERISELRHKQYR